MVNWLVAISFQCFQRDQRYSTAVYQSWVAGERFRPRLHYAGRIRKRSFIFTVKANVHNNPPRLKTELFENPLQTGGIWKRQLYVLVWTEDILKTELFENPLQTGRIWKRQLYVLVWTENILKTELFENDVVTVMWFPWRILSLTEMKNNRWLLRF